MLPCHQVRHIRVRRDILTPIPPRASMLPVHFVPALNTRTIAVPERVYVARDRSILVNEATAVLAAFVEQVAGVFLELPFL